MRFLNKERRASDRRPPRSSEAVLVVGARAIPCQCDNVSPSGAGLRVAAGTLLPPTLTVRIEGKTRPAVIVWRAADRLGVRFTDG